MMQRLGRNYLSHSSMRQSGRRCLRLTPVFNILRGREPSASICTRLLPLEHLLDRLGGILQVSALSKQNGLSEVELTDFGLSRGI